MAKQTQTAPQGPADYGIDKSGSGSFGAAVQAAAGPHTDEKPSLTNYAVAEDLVAQLLAGELLRAIRMGQGTLSPQASGQQSELAVAGIARVFAGLDPRYTAADWNTGNARLPGSLTLPAYIQQRVGHLAPAEFFNSPESSTQTLFALAVGEYRAGIEAFNRDENAEQLQQLGSEIIENYTRILLGLPEHED